jgi:transposase-like protein
MVKRRKRFTATERAKILATAKRQHLTSAQAATKFGISTFTFYAWKRRAKQPARGRDTGRQVSGSLGGVLHSEVRLRVRQMLPEIIRQEVAEYMGQALGTKRGS